MADNVAESKIVSLKKPFSSMGHLIQEIVKLQKERSEEFWFRGVVGSCYGLTPKVYREKSETIKATSDDATDFINRIEPSMIARFSERSGPHLANYVNPDPWNLLFIMQHYGMPTRLLDWSRNLFIAAYFSTDGAPPTLSDLDEDEKSKYQPTIWVLLPKAWNAQIFRDEAGEAEILTAGHDSMAQWKPEVSISRVSITKKKPAVALYSNYNNERIIAQQGVFTIAGASRLGMEKQAEGFSGDEPVLYEFVYDGEPQKLVDELTLLGVGRTMLYPGLDSICTELEREFSRK